MTPRSRARGEPQHRLDAHSGADGLGECRAARPHARDSLYDGRRTMALAEQCARERAADSRRKRRRRRHAAPQRGLRERHACGRLHLSCCRHRGAERRTCSPATHGRLHIGRGASLRRETDARRRTAPVRLHGADLANGSHSSPLRSAPPCCRLHVNRSLVHPRVLPSGLTTAHCTLNRCGGGQGAALHSPCDAPARGRLDGARSARSGDCLPRQPAARHPLHSRRHAALASEAQHGNLATAVRLELSRGMARASQPLASHVCARLPLQHGRSGHCATPRPHAASSAHARLDAHRADLVAEACEPLASSIDEEAPLEQQRGASARRAGGQLSKEDRGGGGRHVRGRGQPGRSDAQQQIEELARRADRL